MAGKVKHKDDAPGHDFRRQFWEGLLKYLANSGHAWAEGRNTTKETFLTFGVGKSGIGVNASMAQGSRMRAEIWCSSDSDKKLFHALLARKVDIEAKFPDEDVSWEPMEEANASRVAVYRSYAKDQVAQDTPYRTELYAWISKNLTTFRTIAKQYLL
jgi:hypothetical protein